MSAPQFLRAGYSDLFGSAMLPVLEYLFRYNIARHQSVREKIFKTVNTERDIWQYTELHDMPLLSSVAEGSDYNFNRPKQGYDKTMTVVKYGLGFSISEEAVDDGKFDFISDAIVKLAKSAMETREQAGMDLLNNGFTSETTPDGQYIFAAAHTTPTGSYTIANKPGTDVDLSFTSLSDALASFKSIFRGDSGIFYNIAPKFLVVPVGLELSARQIVGSALQSGSANNDINPFQNQLQVIASPHLTDADAWFLLADPEENGIRVINRKGIETKAGGSDVGFINDSILYKTRYREVLGAVNCMGLWGTRGA